MKKKFKLEKRKISDQRKKELTFMISAIVLLVIFMPVTTYLITKWNSIIPDGDYARFDNDDFVNRTVEWSTVSEIHKIFTDAEHYQGAFHEETNIIWAQNETDHDTIVISKTGDITVLSFILDLKVSDLINNNMLDFKINLYMDEVEFSDFTIYAYPETNTTLDLEKPTVIYQQSGLAAENVSLTVNLDILDLLVDKVQSDNGRIVFSFDAAYIDYAYNLDTGDLIQFDFLYYRSPETEANQQTVLKIGAVIMGLFFMVVALGSTNYWNPTTPNNPGWVDNKLKNIRKKREDKKKRRKK